MPVTVITPSGTSGVSVVYADPERTQVIPSRPSNAITAQTILFGPRGADGEDGEDGAPGPAGANTGTGFNASTRAAMAAIPSPAANTPVILTEAGREGTFVFRSGDYSALVAVDTAEGVYVAPSSDPTGASGAWVRVFDRVNYDVRWFGYVADNVTDNRPALLAAQAVLKQAAASYFDIRIAPTLLYPGGRAYVSAGVPWTVAVHHRGTTKGHAGTSPGTWLRFPQGSYGYAINGSSNTGYTDVATGTSACGTILDGLGFVSGDGDGSILGGGAAYDPNAQADGVLARTQFTMRNCHIAGFKRNGLAIFGNCSGGFFSCPDMTGNANLWLLEGTNRFLFNGNHGIHVAGFDANAGRQNGVLDAFYNRAWGVLDEAVLPNHFDSVHGVNNGIGNGTTDVDAVCCLVPGGQRYAVIRGQEAAASTTPPPNSSIWFPVPGMINGRVWTSGMQFIAGGPMSLHSGSVVYGADQADGDNPYQHSDNVMHFGSQHVLGGRGQTWTEGGDFKTRRAFVVEPRSWEAGSGIVVRLGGDFSAGDLLYFQPNTGKTVLRLYRESSSNDFLWDFGYSALNVMRFTGQDTTLSFGRSAAQPYKISTHELFLGFNNDARWVSCASAAPTTGNHAQGEIVFNNAPTAGGALGWRCVSAGTPGTWEAFGDRGSPQIGDHDDYELVIGDAGKHYYHTSALPHTLTIPANSAVAFPVGTVIAISNEDGAGDLSLVITSDTLRWNDQTGARTIAANGTASLLKVAPTVWRMTGDAIS